MQIGIVGLPLSGKTTLFQTLTKTHLEPSSLAKGETHQAVIKVPDERLDKLYDIFKPKRKINATIEIVDVVGLQKGETGSPQFTNNFLSKVKTNDALVQVVRLFENEFAPHPFGSIDMMRDINTFETEFIISDLSIVENRIDKIKKQIQKTQDENLKREIPVLEKCLDYLNKEIPLRDAELTKDDLKILKSYQLLSIKPMLIALNLDERLINKEDEFFNMLIKKKLSKKTRAIAFYGKIEMELSELSDEEAKAFMDEYGIRELVPKKLIREIYDLIGLQSFFTVLSDEVRAWTIKKGMNAQEAAGVIHTDFYNKFIRAEVVHYDDFIKYGSFAKAKEHGAWRLEGKEYIVKDGDILTIRHN